MDVNLLQAVGDLGDYPGVWTDRKVFTFLAEHSSNDGTINLPQSVIAQDCGISKSTVSDSVHRLEDKGFLTVEKTVPDGGRISRNIYHIAPWYLVHTKTAKRNTKPRCSACVKPCGSNMDEMRRLARIGEVAADVIKNIFALYEEKSSK